MTIKIDKNIPIPDRMRDYKYPIKDLSVGDSFYVEGMSPSDRSQITAKGRLCNMRLVTRVVDKGIRVWRIE